MLDSTFGRERLRATRRLARRGEVAARFLVLALAYGSSHILLNNPIQSTLLECRDTVIIVKDVLFLELESG